MVDLVSTVLGLVLAATTAIATSTALRIRGRAPFVVSCLVVAAAGIVLLVEALSLVDALTRPAILVGQALLAAAAAGAWIMTGRPRPPQIGRTNARELLAKVQRNPAVAILSAFAGVALLIQFVVAVRVCPNNWDSMTYHMSRAAYWLQNQSAMQCSSGSVRQLYSPPNAEMLISWTMALCGGDRLASLVQWCALVGTTLSVFSLARLIRFPRAASAFAAACFVVLPQPIMQSTTTQNDLVVSFFMVATLVFGIRGIRDRSLGDIAIGATSIGLAIGTKGTAAIGAPALALVLGYALWRFRPPRRFVALSLGFAIVGVLVLGAFNYVQTARNTHSAFGPLSAMVKRTSPVRLNFGRVMWTFADSPGTSAPWLELGIRRPFQGVFGGLKHPNFGLDIDTTTQEDTSAYGLVGLLVFLPLLFVTCVRRRVSGWHRVFALASLGYMLSFAITSEWNPWIGRVLMPGVAIGVPLLAATALRPWFSGVVLTLAVAGLVPSVLMNPQKPLLVNRKEKWVFELDRLQQQSLIRGEMRQVMQGINARVDRSAPLGFVGGEDSWDYPLFGDHLDRRVIRLKYEDINFASMVTAGVGAILVANIGPPPPNLKFEKLADDYYLILLADMYR